MWFWLLGLIALAGCASYPAPKKLDAPTLKIGKGLFTVVDNNKAVAASVDTDTGLVAFYLEPEKAFVAVTDNYFSVMRSLEKQQVQPPKPVDKKAPFVAPQKKGTK